MIVSYWTATLIIVCSFIKILFANTISWAFLNTNGVSGMSEPEFVFIAIPSIFDLLMTLLLVKLFFSLFFFRFFYRSLLKEATYYLKPLIFSFLLIVLVVIDYLPVLKKGYTAENSFGLIYLSVYATALFIYLSFFVYALVKNKNRQHKFEWMKEKNG